MDRLSALSAAFLSAEDVDPEGSLVIGSFDVLAGPAPSLPELQRWVVERLSLTPRYQQRLRHSFLGLRPPGWQDDPGFDIRSHVHQVRLPSPGGRAEVAELVGSIMAERMDRDQPLWDVTLCEGLEGHRWGLLCRVHHALADGVSGTAMLRLIYDTPGGLALPRQGSSAAPGSRVRRLTAAVRDSGRGGLAFTRALTPVHGASVNGPIRMGRRYEWTTMSLSSVRGVRRDLGVTVNDVALAAVTGGFRALLIHRGIEAHPRAIRSIVPVSAWDGGDVDRPDNRVTLMLADLPVELDDPGARVLAVHDLVAKLRRSGEPGAGVVVQQLISTVPYPLVEGVTRLALRLPHHHVSTVTTNVCGPREPLTCLGREVEQMLPYVPIADRVRIGVAMFSYCGDLTFGITSDLDVTDLDVLVRGIDEAWWAVPGMQAAADRGPAVHDRPRSS